MIDKMPPEPPKMMHPHHKSPLEEALEGKRRMQTIRQKYNLKAPKEMKMPNMQWEGEDRS